MAELIDQKYVALAKAIAQKESNNNPNATGDNNTSYGLGQWNNLGKPLKQGELPAVWKEHAQVVFGNSNTPMTEQNQKAVLTGMVAKWAKDGLQPYQIAAKWNSGSENGWENKVGTTNINGVNVSYNVPQYVKEVDNYYKQFVNQTQTSPETQTSQLAPKQETGLFSGLTNKATDVVKEKLGEDSVGYALTTPSRFGMKVGSKIADFLSTSTQQFGKTVGDTIATDKNTDLYSQALQQQSDLVNNLRVAIATGQSEGKDVSRLINTLSQLKSNEIKQEDFTGDVINKTGKQIIGEAAGTGLELLSGGLLSTGKKILGNQALSLGQKALQGSKIGAQFGAVAGASEGLKADKSIKDVAIDSFIGAGLGAALGAATEGVLAVGSKGIGLARKVLNPIEKDVALARKSIAETYEKTLNLTPTQKRKEKELLSKTGDNIYTTLAKHDINLGSANATEQLDSVSEVFRNAAEEARKNEHGLFNLDEAITNAYKQIDERIPSETGRQAAKSKIQNEVVASLESHQGFMTKDPQGNTLVDSDFMERLRKTGNSWTPFNASDPEKVGRSTGYALANSVRDQVEKQGTFPAYRELNKEWGKIIHTQDIIGALEASGKKQFKTLGGLSGSISRRILTGALGYHSGGLGGLVLAEMSGEIGAKVLSNPQLRTYFDRKMIENFGKKGTPEVVERLSKEITDFINKQEGLLKIPAPGQTSAPLITPSPTTYERQAGKINNSNSYPESPKLLPVGNKNTINGATIRLPERTSDLTYERQAGKIGYKNVEPVVVKSANTPQRRVESAPITKQTNISNNTGISNTIAPKSNLSNPSVDKVGNLINEAKKYKSSEEFVKAQGTPVYHGSNDKIKVFSNKKGSQGVIWFTDNPKAITAGESGAQGTKYINERITTGKKFAGWDEYEKLGLGQIESMGFDGIKLPTSMEDGTKYNNYILFNNKSIKSKSQLTDIWKKANKK